MARVMPKLHTQSPQLASMLAMQQRLVDRTTVPVAASRPVRATAETEAAWISDPAALAAMSTADLEAYIRSRPVVDDDPSTGLARHLHGALADEIQRRRASPSYWHIEPMCPFCGASFPTLGDDGQLHCTADRLMQDNYGCDARWPKTPGGTT